MYTIDRFEGEWSEWAIIRASNCQTFKLPRLILPAETWAGDVLSISVTVDQIETKKHRRKYEKYLLKLFKH